MRILDGIDLVHFILQLRYYRGGMYLVMQKHNAIES